MPSCNTNAQGRNINIKLNPNGEYVKETTTPGVAKATEGHPKVFNRLAKPTLQERLKLAPKIINKNSAK